MDKDQMDLYVAFGTQENFKSRLICWLTDWDMSHSWIEYPSLAWSGRWVAHSTSRGVHKEWLPQVLNHYPTYRLYRCKSPAELQKGMEAVVKHIGATKYDYLSVIWNGLLLLVSKVYKPKFLEKWAHENTSKLSCSEFVALVIKESGLITIPKAEWETTGMLEAKVLDAAAHFEPLEEHPHAGELEATHGTVIPKPQKKKE